MPDGVFQRGMRVTLHHDSIQPEPRDFLEVPRVRFGDRERDQTSCERKTHGYRRQWKLAAKKESLTDQHFLAIHGVENAQHAEPWQLGNDVERSDASERDDGRAVFSAQDVRQSEAKREKNETREGEHRREHQTLRQWVGLMNERRQDRDDHQRNESERHRLGRADPGASENVLTATDWQREGEAA